MKDYASMSDQEIGRLVAAANKMDGGGSYGGETLVIRNGVWTRFDPCNNPADAWPIINDNRISLYYDYAKFGECSAHFGDECGGDFDFEKSDANPLRAAMVVFLMMKESENA